MAVLMFSRPPRNRSHRSTDGNSLEPAIGDTTVGLEPGQILVLDNLRVLHGREAFEGKAFLLRHESFGASGLETILRLLSGTPRARYQVIVA